MTKYVTTKKEDGSYETKEKPDGRDALLKLIFIILMFALCYWLGS